MAETFECPCKKEETKKEETVVVRLYDDYDERDQHFLRLSPQAKRLLEFLEEEEMLNLDIEWNFNIESIAQEF